MAARPLDNMGKAKMTNTCQTNRLKNASFNSSHQCARGMRSGTFINTSARPSTGKPINIDRLRNVSGGKPVTPNFMMGQLMPHTSVSVMSVQSWRRVSLGRADMGCMVSLLKSPHDLP